MNWKVVKDRGEPVATLLLVLCALATTGAVVHREVVDRRVESPKPTARSDWRELSSGNMRIGSLNASVTITEFSDFQCPYCKRLFEVLNKVEARHAGQLAIVYKNLPLSTIHQAARPAAIAAQCAADASRFPEYYEYLFAHQDSLPQLNWTAVASSVGISDTASFRSCITGSSVLGKLVADSVAASRLGARGTPTVMINEWKLNEAPTDSVIEVYIQKALGKTRRAE